MLLNKFRAYILTVLESLVRKVLETLPTSLSIMSDQRATERRVDNVRPENDDLVRFTKMKIRKISKSKKQNRDRMRKLVLLRNTCYRIQNQSSRRH